VSRTLVPGEDTVIGRDPTCDVIVAPKASRPAALLEFVSRYHAVLEADEHGHWSVYDNGSTNGTTFRSADGTTVRALTDSVSQSLADGDVIELAHMRELAFTFLDTTSAVDESTLEPPIGDATADPQASAGKPRSQGLFFNPCEMETLLGTWKTSELL